MLTILLPLPILSPAAPVNEIAVVAGLQRGTRRCQLDSRDGTDVGAEL